MRAAPALIIMMLFAPMMQAASPVYPELSLSISPAEVSLAASPNYQEVRFEGAAALDNPSGVPVIVTLSGKVTEGWLTTCSPNLLNFYGSGSMPFNLTLRVDAGACNKTVRAWAEGDALIHGETVSSNQSQKSTIILGDLPGYTTRQNPDSSWLTSTVSGNLAFSPATALLVLIVIFVAIAGLGLVRRRRKRKGVSS
jgi:hypothetical protein